MPRNLAFARRLVALVLPLALAAGLLSGPAARAGEAGPPQIAQGEIQADVGGFSQTQLQSYAAAVRKVQQIDRAWSPKIQQAENQTDAETLTAQATSEMVTGIQAEGLSVQEYNTITQAAEQDQELYNHIMGLLAQAQ